MAKQFVNRSGNIAVRNRVSGAVKAENRAIKNRPSGWSSGEARRTHRRGNARAVARLRASGMRG